MTELALAVAVLAVVAGLALALPAVVRRRGEAGPRSHHLWAVAQANTADGVTARLSVDFVAVIDHGIEPTAVVDAVEDLLRHEIAACTAHQLPSVGDICTGIDTSVEEASIEHLVVASSEIEVTPELRRLIAAAD
ncbi:hypothetical protein ASG90_11960 [Nocardioides sp. Soil797]|nr:hypothetical protein ASG90_11960 [Nocardioides sp. Soil797]